MRFLAVGWSPRKRFKYAAFALFRVSKLDADRCFQTRGMAYAAVGAILSLGYTVRRAGSDSRTLHDSG